jgi:two-component system chemotaxis sensor kinase CheA
MARKFDKSALVARFRDELDERVSLIEEGLVTCENKGCERELVDRIMREAHTLKGSASMMGFSDIAKLAHKLEDVLSKNAVKEGDCNLEALFEILDSIRSAGVVIFGGDSRASEDAGGRSNRPYSNSPSQDSVARSDSMGSKNTDTDGKPGELPSTTAVSVAAGHETRIAPVGSRPKEQNNAPEPRGKHTAEDLTGQSSGSDDAVQSVRVDVKKLDQLMNMVGELVIEKIKVSQRARDLGSLLHSVQGLNMSLVHNHERQVCSGSCRMIEKDLVRIIEDFADTVDQLSFVTSQLQQSVMDVRMLPLEVISRAFPRAVRDIAKEEGKQVKFEITGDDTELDKTIIEAIRDPLLHILRNAVSHGIEPPDVRVKAGKPAAGTVSLKAYSRGSQVIIEVEDDGRGIRGEDIKRTAVENGLLGQDDACAMSDDEVLSLIFTPGFSTRSSVSQVSGRGVGLDVVRNHVAQLKGIVEVLSTPGVSTRITMRLPLTLIITSALFVGVSGETYALPLDHIEETIRVSPEEIKMVATRGAISLRNEIVPLIRLSEVFGLEVDTEPEDEMACHVVIASFGDRKAGLLVDRLEGKIEVVAKPLADHLRNVPYIASATLLGTGDVVLILDVPSLIAGAGGAPQQAPRQLSEDRGCRSVLVVEDSLITRDLEKSILEAAEYSVGVAANGIEALEKLSSSDYDLVLTDVNMPSMDGIEMIRRMKKDARLKDIPVVVLSSREDDRDKMKGLEAGASAYLGKNSFDQAILLDTVGRLIG